MKRENIKYFNYAEETARTSRRWVLVTKKMFVSQKLMWLAVAETNLIIKWLNEILEKRKSA